MTTTRPFRELGIQQIAIGGLDKQRLKGLWVDVFGLAVTGGFVSERENVDEDICTLGSGPTAVEVDLMQPLDPQKKPAVHATPLNHVGLWVDDLRAAVDWMTARGVRFVMLTTVHEYAGHLLAPADREVLQQRHAAYYEDFAQQAGRQLYGAQQTAWLAAVREEEDNLRACLRWAFAAGADAPRVQQGMRIARGLARCWQIGGRIAEGRGWFDQAIALLDAVPPHEQVEVMGQAGLFAQLQGDHAAALDIQARALALARTTGDAALLAYALYTLGSTYGRAGDAPRAADLLAQCLTLRRQLYPGAVTDAQMALTLNNVAVAYVNNGRYAEAEALYTESLAIKRRNDDKFGIASGLINLGDLALRRGDFGRAAQFTRESMELRAALGDQLGLTRALDQMAELAVRCEDYPRAATLFAAATAAYDRVQASRTAHVAIEMEVHLASIQANMTPESYAHAVQMGQRMTLDEAVRFALSTR